MRTVRSFDPCLPCGVHMYLGGGKTLKQRHSPMFGFAGRLKWTSERAEAAIGEVEDDPRAMEAVQAVVAMYGAGLARIVDRVGAPALIDDELVSHLLIVHDLHPVPVEERVRRVLTGGVELVVGGGRRGPGAPPRQQPAGRRGGDPLGGARRGRDRGRRRGARDGPPGRGAEAAGMSPSKLRQVARRAAEPEEVVEHCELCGDPIPPEHRHMLDLRNRELMCACRACKILFDRGAAGGGHYRLVPERRLRLPDFEMDDVAWAELRIPVDMAFFFHNSAGGARGRVLPEPDRADRVAARARRLGRSSSRRTRCSASWSRTSRRCS